MVELIDLVDRYAHEKAWIVNYSNPAAIVAEGVRRLRPNARVLNICDMPVAAMRNMGAILGVDRRKLEVDYFWAESLRLVYPCVGGRRGQAAGTA
ncbi:glycoside hydrolase family protein [Enterobacter cloacae]|uniref:Glycoside hydrolase family protein n=1 Tax=Enterobacter cloacae TaxID=550 RepID=A0A377LVD8_ENTCL|nr:glycoside hydrolase family protein [Enterobacter cloacae]